jgi:protein dithiol:quinone oxidoreductase
MRQLSLPSRFPPPLRPSLAVIGLLCFSALAYAYLLQHGAEKQQPCPLCILQRYVYLIVGGICAIGAIHGKRAYAWLAALCAAVGGGLATWQVLKGGDMTSCQKDPIGIFVNGLPMVDWWPEFFFATGGCADAYSTLGLPVSVWSLICFTALIAALVLLALAPAKPDNRNG